MSLFVNRDLGDTSTQLVPPRTRSYGSTTISTDTALRASAVWACVRLRADLLSTLPIDTYRMVGGMQVEMGTSPFLVDPAGDGFGVEDWLYSSQTDLDRSGNVFGLITKRDAFGNPAQVEWSPLSKVTVIGNGPTITGYRIGGSPYEPRDVWHERQFTVPGIPMGLSPIAYAAMSIGNYLSAQQFALDWFSNGTIPSGRLKNSQRTINPTEANIVKDRFKAAVNGRDLFVHGSDWEYDAISVTANESQFLATMEYGVLDIARFFGIPGDLIDAPMLSSAKITYANITQRNLQLLVMNLAPTIIRRERALSRALPKPRFVKFNTDAFLRLDPQTREAMLASMIASRQIAPSEARALDNRVPFTDAQYAEFDRLFGKAQTSPVAATVVKSRDPERDARPLTIENRFALPPTASPEVRVENHLHERDAIDPKVTVNVAPSPAPDVTITNEVHPADVTVIPADAPVVNIDVQPSEVTVVPTSAKRTKTTTAVTRNTKGDVTGSSAETEVIE